MNLLISGVWSLGAWPNMESKPTANLLFLLQFIKRIKCKEWCTSPEMLAVQRCLTAASGEMVPLVTLGAGVWHHILSTGIFVRGEQDCCFPLKTSKKSVKYTFKMSFCFSLCWLESTWMLLPLDMHFFFNQDFLPSHFRGTCDAGSWP